MHQRLIYKAESERAEAGFSLIELAIVMVIISLLLLPLIKAYDIYRTNKVMNDTKDKQVELSSAINEFFGTQKRYPCPADRSIAFGQPGHGEERCAETVALGLGTCSAGGGYCHVNTGADRAMIGGIPYETLGIPYNKTLDGWMRSMSYAVSERQAVIPTIPVGTEFNPNDASVILEGYDQAGVRTSDVKQHGLIISHGTNGAGSFNTDGIRIPCLTNVREEENCDDNDATFVRTFENGAYLGNTNQYYDDIVSPNAWNSSSIWEFDDPDSDPDTDNENVTAVVPGNLGVGTKTPTEKLEVVGGLRTDKINSFEICDVNGDNCFPATTIGGVGIACPSGQVLTGIAYNQPICRTLPLTGVVSRTCPAGQVVTAIQNGNVICGTP